MSPDTRFTIHDLELLPDGEGKRSEIIDGELYVSTQPHWRHQRAASQIWQALDAWGEPSMAGLAIEAPGGIFAEDETVAPDVVWVSRERLARVVGEDGKLHAAPDLMVEVLAPGETNKERDRELKRKLYARRGVQEYWILDWRETTIQVYRRESDALQLADTLTSPPLPGFSWPVGALLATPL